MLMSFGKQKSAIAATISESMKDYFYSSKEIFKTPSRKLFISLIFNLIVLKLSVIHTNYEA